ncbi:septation protein A [Candidatus Albibeggiatoa sp. nov. BB20]|uniref:septation protein A n=1 Tax=Candidatus Albibeggiatoa sp. nov. BB20 TaxID=3162723 RepID=UPI0033659B3A
MKFLYDFFPILLFFIAYKVYGIFVATAVAIAASFAQVTHYRIKHKRFETMQLVTFGLITVLGGATLILHDENFIKWKPSIVNWLFAVAFLGSQWIGEKPLIQRFMDQHIQVDEPKVWTVVNLSWVGFFIFSGLLNLYVAFNFSTDVWVNFKLFGLMGLTFIFVIIQGIYLTQHVVEVIEEDDKEQAVPATNNNE